ncbi:hypothetical protein SLEP1_g52371 [Rubroshorea leprosula]|uniref:Disease resistance protein RGA3 n=1 Tax=Rubroshorea leprosula TaxID=152421 RepID=A0AAV5M611_9ROSI|nr:hypothetical protein SLEP1_g52371 [Rubroshorea leprosula]
MAADLILGSVLDVTLSKVISVVNEQLNLAVGFEEELRRFDGKLKMIQGVLQDAEQKGMVGDPVLKSWLEGLRSQAEEADDMMDEIAYENLRCKVAQMSEKVSYFSTLFNPLAFRLKMANRIKSFNLELDDLHKIATGLGLQQILAIKHPEHIETQQTDSSIGDPSKIVGRENKVLEVVESLIDSSNDQPLLVVSIVGMGGIGKTTMAKLVYNNGQIQRHFFKRMWICVSENFNLKQILVAMLQAFDENGSLYTQDIVVQKLQEKLRENNYLLILDDVWNEDWQKWESLRSCLLGIGKTFESRVLITTRSENVASTVGTLSKHMHHLEMLTDEDCWYIIKQRAFVSSSFSSELEGIGRDIASKCRGIALVANVIGGILCNNMKKDYWLSIKDNNVWCSMEEAGGVLGVLQLSLNRLPIPALKQCFAFCSIFPKDFVIEKEMLIQLWMAEGFLQPFSETHLEMEDIGDKYFNALSSYSLFQDVERDSYGSIITCKMHDLIHDLAQSVSKSQTLILEDGSGRNIPANIQHLNVISIKGMATTKLGDVPKKLHTLFSQIDVLHSMSTNLKKVRVLSFCGADIDELPAFLGEMKHLRFLDVSDTKIKELPKFITKLYHLQTFRFMNCEKIDRPLEGIWDLVNLRYIYFNREELMPAGIGRLTCLKTLQLFVVGEQKGHQIEELGCLSQLRGKLKICNLCLIRDKEEAMGARLSEKDTIQELQLVFGAGSDGSEDGCKHCEDILEGLQPHANLKGLIVEHYHGKSCPAWMLEIKNSMSERVNFLNNLMVMTFSKCPWLESIPSLSLSNEAKVEIKNCKNLKSIAVLSLQKLIIEECGELVEVAVGTAAMESIKEVHINSCGNLENLPMISKLQSLKILHIRRCRELKIIGDDAPFASTCLQELSIVSCGRLMSMPRVDGLSSLQKIEMNICGPLKSIGESLSIATCLKELTIVHCNELASLPSLYGLSFLQEIDIRSCGQLKSIGEDLSTATGLKELTIRVCDGLMSFPNLHRLSSLQKIDIRSCGQLKSIGEDLSTVTCLKELTIWECNGLMSFPNLHGVSSLQKIDILNCRQLKSIGEDLSTATCLKELTIRGCDGLMSFPNLHGLSSLQKIDICRCGQLKSIGEDLSTATCLKELTIMGCDGLMSFPNLHGLSSLQKIDIRNCGQLKSIGEDLSTATCLKELTICSCNGLMSFPNLHGLSSLQTLSIKGCGRLRSLPSGLPSCIALESLDISYCDKLISIPDDLRRSWSWSIANPACLARLKRLTIGGFSTELKEFSDLGFIESHLEELTLIAWGEQRERLLDQIQHQTALKSLKIRDFDGLESLPNWFGSLSSLQTLEISNCKSLKHMKAIGCLSKLESLYIERCPELKERCTRGSGSEWNYISHIQKVKIDRWSIQPRRTPIKTRRLLHKDDDNEQQGDDSEQQGDDSEQQGDDSEQQVDDSEQQGDDSEQQGGDSEQQGDDSEQQGDDSERQGDDSEQLPVQVKWWRRFICCRN